MNTATWNMLGAKHSQENKWNEGVKNLIAQKKTRLPVPAGMWRNARLSRADQRKF